MTPSIPSKDRLRIALQKSGRLASDSLELLARCGVRIKSPKERLMLHAENFPLDVLFVRDDDIPQLVMDDVCDLGLVGTNVLEETALERGSRGESTGYTVERSLSFGRCRLCIAIAEEREFNGVADLNGLRIATTYPRLTGRYLESAGVKADIVTLTGSVEIAPRLGLADAICDLVSTGSTLDANRLRVVETIFKSQAALIRSPGTLSEKQQHALDILMRRIEGVLKADETKYIMLHAPKDRLDEIKRLLPGAENPTILPLAGDDSKVALHAVCSEDVFWETMESLKKCGASSILVLPIEKMMQ